MRTPKTPADAMDLEEEQQDYSFADEYEEHVGQNDMEEEGEGEGEDVDDAEEVFAEILIDDGPNQTPLQTPMKTPKKTPHKIPKTPRTILNTAKTPKIVRPKKAKRKKSELDVAALTNEQAALAALESDQILHLRLRKKYYAEALNFIRQVEGAMEMLGQLLGSTNKAEVLETMEFFRVAYEYQFDRAQVSGRDSGPSSLTHWR
jgi:condensin complex subunit 1